MNTADVKGMYLIKVASLATHKPFFSIHISYSMGEDTMTYTANSFPRQITFSAKCGIGISHKNTPGRCTAGSSYHSRCAGTHQSGLSPSDQSGEPCQGVQVPGVCSYIHEDALGLIQYLKLTAVINKPYVMPKHQQMRMKTMRVPMKTLRNQPFWPHSRTLLF